MELSDNTAITTSSTNLLPRRHVIYCGACGMPPEYCEYGPDYETHCLKWLAKHHPELYQSQTAKTTAATSQKQQVVVERPSEPWSIEQRLTEFYKKYQPDKVDGVPALLEKYAGKEEKLFAALVQKYGREPVDPYFADDSDSESDDDENENENEETLAVDNSAKKKRRGAGAKKDSGADARVVITKVAQKKKRNLTIVAGMETIPGVNLKDVSKALSKKFAGSSSVKENTSGEKEIILQGDHMYDVAELVIDAFGVPESAVFLDMDGEIVPFK
jgi:density-regulated protein DRP1